MNDLISWLRQQLDDDERWALAANQPYRHADEGSKAPVGGVHWRWVTGDEWETAVPDPALNEFVAEPGYPCWLVTVEEWPVTHRMADGTPLRTHMAPRSYADQIVEMDAAAAGLIIRHDPARVLRQVAAQRSILNLCAAAMASGEVKPGTTWNDDAAGAEVAEATIRLLAEVYADRPGYREEWRP